MPSEIKAAEILETTKGEAKKLFVEIYEVESRNPQLDIGILKDLRRTLKYDIERLDEKYLRVFGEEKERSLNVLNTLLLETIEKVLKQFKTLTDGVQIKVASALDQEEFGTPFTFEDIADIEKPDINKLRIEIEKLQETAISIQQKRTDSGIDTSDRLGEAITFGLKAFQHENTDTVIMAITALKVAIENTDPENLE